MSSILTDTKGMVNIPAADTSFDLQIVIAINSALATLTDLGVGPEAGFSISDQTATWDGFIGNDPRYNDIKAYVYLKVRMIFDPPTTSFAITAMNDQIDELVWRINARREWDLDPTDPMATT